MEPKSHPRFLKFALLELFEEKVDTSFMNFRVETESERKQLYDDLSRIIRRMQQCDHPYDDKEDERCGIKKELTDYILRHKITSKFTMDQGMVAKAIAFTERMKQHQICVTFKKDAISAIKRTCEKLNIPAPINLNNLTVERVDGVLTAYSPKECDVNFSIKQKPDGKLEFIANLEI